MQKPFFGQTNHEQDMFADLAKAALERNIDVPALITTHIKERLPQLVAGDDYPCSLCHGSHVVERPDADKEPPERSYLYVTCRGYRFLVGRVRI